MQEGPLSSGDTLTDELLRFQQEALAVLHELCPDRTVAAGADAWSVRVDTIHVALHNAFVESQRQHLDRGALRAFLRTRFSALLSDTPVVATDEPLDAVRDCLLPQFMPANYVKLAALVSFPFHEALDIGLVVDRAQSYRYVKRTDLDRWNIAADSVLDLAIDNLDARSRNIPVHFSGDDGPEKFIALETRDGFDAARILLPRFQQFVAEHLGDPYGFAIPNRDFLICWAATNSVGFKANVAEKVAQDFTERAYSLSPATFRWHAGRILKDT
jgi:hypothetical protein